MKTVSFKVDAVLDRGLTAAARDRAAKKSDIIREALRLLLAGEGKARPGSCLDLASDLFGSVKGPTDLSTNRRHLEGFGR